MDTLTTIVVILAALAALAGIGWLLWAARRRRLRERFGPEYDRAVDTYGDRGKAEKELLRREGRRRKFEIRALSPDEQDGFADAWRRDQTQFVDDPRPAVAKAHQLVTELMRVRGYPVTDFEEQAADLSVDHPGVVENYRRAYELYGRQQRGAASTEDLRAAMLHYRQLFEELLGRRVRSETQVEIQRTEWTR